MKSHRGAWTFAIVALGAVTGGVAVRILADAERGEMIAVALGVAALIYALRQFSDAGQTLSGIEGVNENLKGLPHRLDDSVGNLEKELRESLKGLERQLSTKQLGPFPAFMPEIVNLLEGAEGEIVICCDHPAYGVFSAPKDYESYAKAIQQKIKRGIPVSLLCNDTLRRAQLRKIQIKVRGEWKKWQWDKRMPAFLAKHGGAKKLRSDRLWAMSITEKEFLGVLTDTDKRALREVFSDAQPHRKVTTHDVLPLYFWMARGRREQDARAVFALAPLAKGALEVGFRTEDPALILALKGIFERYDEVVQDSVAEVGEQGNE